MYTSKTAVAQCHIAKNDSLGQHEHPQIYLSTAAYSASVAENLKPFLLHFNTKFDLTALEAKWQAKWSDRKGKVEEGGVFSESNRFQIRDLTLL
jgi:hypothetical protein